MSDRIHVAAYQRLLLVLPNPFRRRYANQMVAAFEADLFQVRRVGARFGVVGHWARSLIDLCLTVASERSPFNGPRKKPRNQHRKVGMSPSGLYRDVRYGLRSLRRSKGFTVFAILIVALGVGANATVFSMARAMLWTDPPLVSDPGSLVRITRASATTQSGGLGYSDYAHYRDANDVFSGVMAYEEDGFAASMSLGDGVETVHLGSISDNYFDVLGVRMLLGREFASDEDRIPGVGAVAVLSHGLWTRSFGADSGVIGQRITLNGHPFSIIGVGPREFVGVSPIEAPPDIWTPLHMYGVLRNSGNAMLVRTEGEIYRWLSAVGRLRDGVSIEAASANMEGLARYLAENFSEWNEGQSVYLSPHIGYRPSDHSTVVTIVRLLMSVVVLVMVVASANMAMILLARASTREQEISIRLALGANRSRLIRQLLVESSILGLGGAVAGYIVAIWATRPIATLLPSEVVRSISPDFTVLVFSVVLGLLVVAVFGTIPAFRATRFYSGTRGTAGPGRSWGRAALVVGQVAVSVIIAAGAILFTRSLRNARSVDLGFETENRLVVSFNLQRHGYDVDAVPQFLSDVLERVRALPGVEDVTSIRVVPFQGSWGSSFTVPGITPPDGARYFDSGFNAVGPDYFEIMRVPLVAGRGMTAQDGSTADPVVVINQELARRVWGTEDVVGRTITWRSRPWTIVGVARDGTYYELGESPEAQIFIPVMQEPAPGINLLIATSGDPTIVTRPVENVIHAIDPNIAIVGQRTMDDFFSDEIGRYRVAATMVGIFGSLGIVLAAVGLYGVLSFLVVQRTREIGVRIALGASAGRVAGDVVARGLRVASIGIIIGLFAAIASARVATAFLFGISARDPLTFVVSGVLLAAVAALASAIPARRAARVDPMKSLRFEI